MDQAECPKAIFILGSPRSGTSILAWSLAQHPGLWTSSESDFIFDLFGYGRMQDAFDKSYRRSDRPWLVENEVSYKEFAAHLGSGVSRLFQSRAGRKQWVDATPTYTLMADDLTLLFPSACFVHILRDGRAVVSSMIHSGFGEDFAINFEAACQTWSYFAQSARKFQLAHPDRAMEVRLEAVAEEPDLQFNRILEFLCLESCGDPAEFFRTHRINSSYGNVTSEDIEQSKPERSFPKAPWLDWNTTMRQTFIEIAGPTMYEMGYTVEFE